MRHHKPHPLHAFKQARRDHLHALCADERCRQESVEFEVWRLLHADVGDDVMEHVTIKCVTVDPPVATLGVEHHIPITAAVKDGKLSFVVERRMEVQAFEHFADALAFGEPYGASNPPPPAPVSFEDEAFDTTPPDEAVDG